LRLKNSNRTVVTAIENIQKHHFNLAAVDNEQEDNRLPLDRELTLKEIEAKSDEGSLDRKYFENPQRLAQSQLEERHNEQYLSRFAREYVRSQKSNSENNRLSSLEKMADLPRSSQLESLNLTTEDNNLRASNPF
jgi:hypothetical protein